MLEPPSLQAELLQDHLLVTFGIALAHLAFLPLGADVNSAVYRAVAADQRVYFLRLRRGALFEPSVLVPDFLAARGVAPVIAPLHTRTGQLWSRFHDFTVTLYPFVAGVDGYERVLTAQRWTLLGSALARIHATPLPAPLRRSLPQESYSPAWRNQVKTWQAQLRAHTPTDPVAAALAHELLANAGVIDALVAGADQLAQQLAHRQQEQVLCHADLHAGNLLITEDGALYIVDWDTVILAPKERDLMFPGSGLGPGWDDPQSVAWFYAGYGATPVDVPALAYYRCERIVQDIAEFCAQILATDGDSQDRSQALHYLRSQFDSGGVIEIALETICAS